MEDRSPSPKACSVSYFTASMLVALTISAVLDVTLLLHFWVIEPRQAFGLCAHYLWVGYLFLHEGLSPTPYSARMARTLRTFTLFTLVVRGLANLGRIICEGSCG